MTCCSEHTERGGRGSRTALSWVRQRQRAAAQRWLLQVQQAQADCSPFTSALVLCSCAQVQHEMQVRLGVTLLSEFWCALSRYLLRLLLRLLLALLRWLLRLL